MSISCRKQGGGAKTLNYLIGALAACAMGLAARAAALPDGYTELEYLDTDGTQYLNTGFTPDATCAIAFDFTLLKMEDSKAIFCSSWATYAWLAQTYQSKLRWFGYNDEVGAFSANVRYILSANGGTVSMRNVETGAVSPSVSGMSMNNSNGELKFFGDGAGRNAKVRFYGCIITKNGQVVRNFIPVKRDSDGKAGIYDLAGTGGFLVEATGNAFAGSEVGAREAALVVSGYAGTTKLENFQTLVKLTGANYGFRYSHTAADNGADLYFTDPDGNIIPHEIDTWNATGESFVWVRVPEINPVSQEVSWFKMHWGAPLADVLTAEQIEATKANIWSDGTAKEGNFVGVWHMNASGAANEPDKTGNNSDGVPQALSTGADTSTMTTTAGIVGTSRINKAAKGNCMKAAFDQNAIYDYSKHTITGWWTSDAYNYYDRFVSYGEGSTGIWQADFYGNGTYGYHGLWDGPFAGGGKFDFGSACTSFKYPNWVYLTIVFNGTTAQIYANGVLVKNSTGLTAKARPSATPFFMIGAWINGAGNWNGKYDEVRLYDGAQSGDRVKADYDTIKTPTTFLTLGESTTLKTATWTGAAGDGDLTNPANWDGVTIFNQAVSGTAIPSEATDVTIASQSLFINKSSQSVMQFKTLTFGNCKLASDCDLSGLESDLTGASGTIDLNGKKLTLTALNAGATTITDTSSGEPGELHLNISSGTAANTAVALTGNLKFVKEGAGTYNANKAGQTYSGGTEIAGGTVMFNTSGNNSPLGAKNSTITVSTGGKLQFKGHYFSIPLNVYKYVLNGGTIENVDADVWGGDIHMSDLELTADSELVASMNFGLLNKANEVRLNMNDNKLTVYAPNKWFMAGNLQLSGGGEIEINGDTGMYVYGASNGGAVDARNTKMTLKGTILLDRDLLVTDYTAIYTGTGQQKGTGGSLRVYGTFKPTVDRFMGCTLQNGSTIDLTGWDSATLGWPVYSHADIGGSAGTKPLKFAADATTVNVAIDVNAANFIALAKSKDAGTGACNGYLLEWGSGATQHPRPASTNFRLVDGDGAPVASRYKLVNDTAGLLLMPMPGLAITIR